MTTKSTTTKTSVFDHFIVPRRHQVPHAVDTRRSIKKIALPELLEPRKQRERMAFYLRQKKYRQIIPSNIPFSFMFEPANLFETALYMTREGILFITIGATKNDETK